MKSYGNWDRVKVSVCLVELLQTHPLFKSQSKAINSAQYWLNALDKKITENDGEGVTWDHEDIKTRFQYCKGHYTQYRDALRDLELIVFSNWMSPGFKEGECRTFRTTPLCHTLLGESNYEYLYKLFNDPKERRKNQQSVSDRRKAVKPYTDKTTQLINDFNFNVTFQPSDVLKQLELDKETNPDRYSSAAHQMKSLVQKQFKRLEEKQGRIYNTFTALPKEYKKLASVKGKKYSAILDIRACHPTFLSRFLLDYFNGFKELYPNGPDDATGFDYNVMVSFKKVNGGSLLFECAQWNEIFTGEKDPREVINNQMGMGINPQDIKQCLNCWVNGAKKYKRPTDQTKWDDTDLKRLEKWFRYSFPEMGKVWDTFGPNGRKITGITIQREYEGRLMLDLELYSRAESHGVVLSYEYDGIGILSDPTMDVDPVITDLQKFLSGKSNELFELPIVIKGEKISR